MTSQMFLDTTCERMIREELPNFFRLFLNPFVAQTCFCLDQYVQTTWRSTEPTQTFLANSFDEALSGAIKLARYHASLQGRSSQGLIIDAGRRLGPFASVDTTDGVRVEFVPGVTVVENEDSIPRDQVFGFVAAITTQEVAISECVPRLIADHAALFILGVSRRSLARHRHRHAGRDRAPDIVLFDESFVDNDVPFGAFTARRAIFDAWNHRSKSTFHSTTFQPNTVSTFHFMNCLQASDPEFYGSVKKELTCLEKDLDYRKSLFRQLYSPSLTSAIALTGCQTDDIRARGHYVTIDGRKVFDAVGGVACSIRGHNPVSYVSDLHALDRIDWEQELASRLQTLTHLECMLPAVSGASAVETALRLALAANSPRRHVLALQGGFGGKTLFALTGTWKKTYKAHIEPLYHHVSYVDPFAVDAVEQIDTVLAHHDVAVAQIELIQGVGGVRPVPDAVIRHLDERRKSFGFFLLIDEVQTGMFRTGPFTRSSELGVTPDLLVIGKAISDMTFPFALTLYSSAVAERVKAAAPDLPEQIRRRHEYPTGFKTALNVLRYAERIDLAERVRSSSRLFTELLEQELATCPAVRGVRIFGLLIGIELDASRWPQRWFKQRLFWFFLAALLKNPQFPVLIGFCQAEPNVLKITPPLTIDPDEIRQMCAVIGKTLRRPFYQLLASALGDLLGRTQTRRQKREHALAAPDGASTR